MLESINVTELYEIITVDSPKGRYLEMQNRETYGLSFCYSGKIAYHHNGQVFLSDKRHAVFLPKNADYTLYGEETGAFALINFDCTGFPGDTFLSIPIEDGDSFLIDFEKLKSLSLFPNNALKIKSIFYDMLGRLSDRSTGDDSIILPGIRHIQTHYADTGLSNRELAQICQISEVYFRRLFVKQTGTTPKQYILDVRLKRAKQLLESKGVTVTEIAECCGFSGVYHFCRSFKANTGLTPTAYRRNSVQNPL